MYEVRTLHEIKYTFPNPYRGNKLHQLDVPLFYIKLKTFLF
jgi:hypothetical protein